MTHKMFTPRRARYTYRQTIQAGRDTVYPLLCPVREAEWLDGWDYQMIYSESGLIEAGAVFSTAHAGEPDTVWLVSRYEPDDFRIDFTRFTPDSRTCLLEITVHERDPESSYVDIKYTYTTLSPAGDAYLNTLTSDAFLEAVRFWEKSMNHYLDTGRRLEKSKIT